MATTHDTMPTKATLQPNSHDPMLLVAAARQSFECNVFFLGYQRICAILKFRHWLDLLAQRLALNRAATMTDDWFLQEGLNCINIIFFMGCMTNEICWASMDDDRRGGTSVRTQRIEIDRHHILLEQDPTSTAHTIAEVMIHEACHAYLLKYRCPIDCPSCDYYRIVGPEGHGHAWQRLIGAVRSRVALIGLQAPDGFGLEREALRNEDLGGDTTESIVDEYMVGGEGYGLSQWFDCCFGCSE